MIPGEQLPDNSLANLTSLLGILKGKSQTSTTSSNISDEGVNALIQQILGGSQGLAAVSSGQKSAGLYSSTVNQQLTNDLVSRTAGEVAKAKAGTTTKTTTPPQISGGNILSLIASLGAGQAISAGGKKLMGSKLGQTASANASALAETLMGSTSIPLSSFVEANSTADPLGALIASQGWSPGVAGGKSAASLGSGAGLAGVGSAVDATGALVGAGETADLLAAANATADPLGAFVGSLGYDVSAGAGAGTAASSLVGAAEIGTDAAALAGTAEAGFTLADALPAIATWVICTEMNRQGRLSDELYQASGKRALTLSSEVIQGYHFWAIPLTRKLRTSRFLSSVFGYLAKSRCEYLLGSPRIWGWVSVHLGEPICGWLGKKVAKKDWKVLYG